MSFTKQIPTKPGAYWWKDETELTIAIITKHGDCLYSSVNGKARQHVELVGGEWEGPLISAEEAQADAAAMREALTKERAAIARFLVPWRSHLDQSWLDNFVESGSVRFNEIGYVFPVEVSTNAGSELLEELQRLRQLVSIIETETCENCNYQRNIYTPCKCGQFSVVGTNARLRAELKSAREELDDVRAVFQHGADEDHWTPGTSIADAVRSLSASLAKAHAQCAKLRSEVERAWREGFIDGDFGEASADDCWNQSRARKVATGELNK